VGPNTLQAPHLTVAVFARGMLKQLYTRLYFAGDPRNENDPILALVPADRRDTLMAKPDSARAGHWRFDVRLQRGQETVFFDV
jgi:protocatechuate 3,4-dioxygenase, alpha subunit